MGIFKDPKSSHFRQFLWSKRSSRWGREAYISVCVGCTELSCAKKETPGRAERNEAIGRPLGLRGSERAHFPAHCYGRKKTGCPWPLGKQSPLGDLVRGPQVSEDTQVSASGLHTHSRCRQAQLSSGGSFAGAWLVRPRHSDSREGWAPSTHWQLVCIPRSRHSDS